MKKFKITALVAGLTFTLPSFAQEELDEQPIETTPPPPEENDVPEADEAGSAPSSGPRAFGLRAFVGTGFFDLSGAYKLESEGTLNSGLEGSYEFANGTSLRALAAMGQGTWTNYAGGFTHYDFAVDWLQRVQGQDSADYFSLGLGLRAHGLGPDEDVLWNHYGGHDMVTLRLALETGFRFKTDWKATAVWGIGVITFGGFAVDKEMLPVEDGFEQTFQARLAYAPMGARYAVDLYVASEDGAYEFEDERVSKVKASEIGLGFEYGF